MVEMKALTAMRAGGEPSVSRQVPIALMDVDSWAGRRVWASFDGDIMADGGHVYLSLVLDAINSPQGHPELPNRAICSHQKVSP